MNDCLKAAHLRDCQVVEHLLAVAAQLSHLLNILYVIVFASVFVFVFANKLGVQQTWEASKLMSMAVVPWGIIICLLSLLATFCQKEIEEKNIT